MRKFSVPHTCITDLPGVRHPIVWGELGAALSDARYVAAVVNAGSIFDRFIDDAAAALGRLEQRTVKLVSYAIEREV